MQELLKAAASLKAGDGDSGMSPLEKALLQPNKDGHTVLHLALQAGPLVQSQVQYSMQQKRYLGRESFFMFHN